MFDVYINDYDWGPGISKVVLTVDEAISAENIQASDFDISVKMQGMDWKKFVNKMIEGKRNVTAAYPVNQEGEKVDKSNLIALELSVHPADPFSNPFFYSSEMVNKWSVPYDCVISNKKLKIESTTIGKKICPLADQFEIGKSSLGEITLSYAAYNPPKAEKGKTPVIIWLHGMGEGGTDPYIALLGNRVVNLITENIQKHFGPTGAIVLVPQTPGFWLMTNSNKNDMKNWASNFRTPAVSFYTKALFNLIDNYVKSNPNVDMNRIYVGGCSNGGYMTMNMLIEYPDYFAAAYPVCEVYPDRKIDEKKLEKLCRQNIWFTHAKNDRTVNPKKCTVKTFKRLKKAGAKNVHFSFFDDVHDTSGLYKDFKGDCFQYNGHWSWIYTLTNQCKENDVSIMEWMASQKKEN
ncbi:MAG: prolyl oligopeptidase family serine peptidase [Treponema sp.]|nr:prolyl oligopeptidase family serine peptidase [Treponema sp.]